MEGSIRRWTRALPNEDSQILRRGPDPRDRNPGAPTADFHLDQRQGLEVVFGKEEKEVAPDSTPTAGLQVVPLEYTADGRSSAQLRVGGEEKEHVLDSDPASGLQVHHRSEDIRKQGIKQRLRSRRFIATAVIGIIIIIAASILAGTLVSKQRRSNGSTSSPAANTASSSSITAIGPSSTGSNGANQANPQGSQSGPLTGTRMAVLNENNGASTDSLSDNGSGPSTGWLFYIGASGDIRYAVHNTSGVWQHGQSLAIANVSNQSSLTVVSYKLPSNDTTYRRLFYIDESRILQDVIFTAPADPSTSLGSFKHGNLGQYKFSVAPDGATTLTVAGNNKTAELPDPGDVNVEAELSLFAGGKDGRIHEYNYHSRNNTWAAGFVFPSSNGYSGFNVPDFEIGTGTLEMYLTNANNELEVWERSAGVSGIDDSGTTEPWTKLNSTSLRMHPNSSIWGDSTNIYFQGLDLSINVMGWDPEVGFGSPQKINNSESIPGTAIVTGNFNGIDSTSTFTQLFVQSNDTNITAIGSPSSQWINLGDLPLG